MDPSLFVNRELSWLAFNERVLNEAADERNPLLERLKFIAIFSTNLDEFYMVRIAGLRRQVAAGVHTTPPDGLTASDQLAAIATRIEELTRRQRHCLHDVLLPELAERGVRLATMSELSVEGCARLDAFFETELFPVLTPLGVDPTHPFPYISNLSLSLAVQLFDPDLGVERFARVKVPKLLPRWVPTGEPHEFVPLEQVISANLGALFPGMQIRGSNAFRITRYSDLELQASEDTEDLLAAIEEQLFQRRFAEVVRVEVQSRMPQDIRALLVDELAKDDSPELAPLAAQDLVDAGPLLELGDLMLLASLDIPELRDPPLVAVVPPALRDASRSVFAAIRERDILLHHPFESFTASVEHFIESAAQDDNVLAIKTTLYRTSGDTAIVRALTEAAQRGKQVAVLVELQARFDEVNNITWARTLENFGVHVAYGLPGLKTHAKTALVVRREPDGIRRYVHIGTGNYNSKTARVYTDLGLLTTDQAIGADASELFNALTGFSRQRDFRKLLVAPNGMRERLIALIDSEAERARSGGEGRIIAKMNALVDAVMIGALYAASQAGVEIDLIVRGVCCLRPGLPGVSDHIRVTSIVGRFLEHSRLFHFGNGDDALYYLGSADWMPRNFDRRVEVLTPVDDRALHPLLASLLESCLRDNRNAWDMAGDGSYTQRRPEGGEPVRATPDVLRRDPWGRAEPL